MIALHDFSLRQIRRYAPTTLFWDRVYSFIYFHKRHRRLPRRRGWLLNDFLYFVKTASSFSTPLRQFVTDKEFVKDYIQKKVGARFAVPTYGIIRDSGGLERVVFPDRCVIKPTHSYGEVIIRHGGEAIDKQRVRRWFGMDHYRRSRQRNYLGLRPKVMVEPIIFDNPEPTDFKFYCYRGVPRAVDVIAGRRTKMLTACYTTDWEKLPYAIESKQDERAYVSCPQNFREMLEISARLSAPFAFMRVDLYSDNSRIYVGELTSIPGNAASRFVPTHAEELFTDLVFGREVRAGEVEQAFLP